MRKFSQIFAMFFPKHPASLITNRIREAGKDARLAVMEGMTPYVNFLNL